MKNLSRTRFFHYILSLLLLGSVQQLALAQFQSTIGFAYPASEQSPGGIVLPNGEYIIPAGNFDHPNALFGPTTADWELVQVDAVGNLLAPSKLLGRPPTESVNWMELTSCSGQNQLIVAGTAGGEMTLTFTDLAGNAGPIKETGTTANAETAACVKVDGGGNIVLVGTQIDANTGQENVVVVKVDCNGMKIWDFVFSFNGWSAQATSVTTFDTFQGSCSQASSNQYYITGKMTPLAGGDDQVFILAVDAVFGGFGFARRYDINPSGSDVGTCIQANCGAAGLAEIWVSGYSFENTTGSKLVMMLKTDNNGTPIWTNNYDIAGGDEFATHFIQDASGKLIVTGKAQETLVAQGLKSGNGMLMRIDGSGNTVDWTRAYINMGFSSQGNRVASTPNGNFFVTGQSLEVITPSQSASDILALLTDNNGQTDPSCFTNPATTVISRPHMFNTFSPANLSLALLDFYLDSGLDTLSYTDQQVTCGNSVTCVCDFTYTTGDCFQVNFTAACQPPGNYTYEWEIGCPGGTIIPTNNPNYTHTFPCGGGTFNVCLNVYLNGILCSSVSHQVVVPTTCCGPILTANAVCTPINNTYNFVIEVGNAPGAASCQQPNIQVNTAGTSLANLNYTNLGTSWLITGSAQVLSSTSTSLNFSVQSTCICPMTGLPMTCNQSVTIPLPCCKVILVDDQEICHDLNSFDVPILTGPWSPLQGISQVSWYVMPKPAGGCPAAPWGGTAYQDDLGSNLEPLHIYPSSLAAGEYCVYVVVYLNDGPCQILTSNIATLTICDPNGCSLNDYEYCYMGTPIIPGSGPNPSPLTLNLNSSSTACTITKIEWFDPQGNLVQTGGTTYQPTQAISMQNDQLCYEDTLYTVQITDACGVHSCQARIRLYSDLAPIGSLTMGTPTPPFVCCDGDATLFFDPECAGDPASWSWYSQDQSGGPVNDLFDAGLMNNTYLTGQLNDSYLFYVEASNGICPPKQEQLLVEVKEPLAFSNFSGNSDICVEQFVDLTLDIVPCTIKGTATPCNCSYMVHWYKDGVLIGSTPNTPPTQATFSYTNPIVYGTYYAVIESDCCPGESLSTYPLTFHQSCDPVIMGPCFICDNQLVTLMGMMVLPPDSPCPYTCMFSWFSYDPIAQTETPLGTGATWNTTMEGFYILESDCFGCIKRDTFELAGCLSNPCRRTPVSIEELFSGDEQLLRFYPNPAFENVTVEWLKDRPKDAVLSIVGLAGRIIRTIEVPNDATEIKLYVEDLPSGVYFIQVREGPRIYKAAKLIKE